MVRCCSKSNTTHHHSQRRTNYRIDQPQAQMQSVATNRPENHTHHQGKTISTHEPTRTGAPRCHHHHVENVRKPERSNGNNLRLLRHQTIRGTKTAEIKVDASMMIRCDSKSKTTHHHNKTTNRTYNRPNTV
jgi:hypothetical protein